MRELKFLISSLLIALAMTVSACATREETRQVRNVSTSYGQLVNN
jgi:Flp pilus assembly protein TadD